MEVLALLDQEGQLHNRKESIRRTVMCARIELQPPNARSCWAIRFSSLLNVVPDHVV